MNIGTPQLPGALSVVQAWASSVTGILNAVVASGTTANRPTKFLWVGRPFMDTTLGIPIWIQSITAGVATWVDATGAAV